MDGNFTQEPAYSFMSARERDMSSDFLSAGYHIGQVEDTAALERIRNAVVDLAATHLGMAPPSDAGEFLDNIGRHVTPDTLNALRLAVFGGMKRLDWFRPAYFALARQAIETLVGNELAMQRNINLSIQMPGDESSLLPVHADSLNGDSPYEVVVWLPLVDCYASKSMYLLPPAKNSQVMDNLADFEEQDSEALFRSIEPDLLWMNVGFGQFLLFSQNLLHGNRVNQEITTRWSMNCRFKSLLSPYADKQFGEFFEPITLRPATRLGMSYKEPGGFHD